MAQDLRKLDITGTLGSPHPDSPAPGDVVVCTDPSRKLTDPKGYRVEEIGWSKGTGTPYGTFGARGVAWGGLYHFSVTEWEPFQS